MRAKIEIVCSAVLGPGFDYIIVSTLLFDNSVMVFISMLHS